MIYSKKLTNDAWKETSGMAKEPLIFEKEIPVKRAIEMSTATYT